MDPATANLAFDVFSPDCPSRKVFDHIFSRWGILVLAKLSADPVRFGSLRRSIGGISEKMLSQTLRVLEEEGLVRRQEWDEKPPRVEYALTESGLRIAARLKDLLHDLYSELRQRC